MTLNDCVALRLGEPLSVTTSVKVLVVPLSAGPVCQVMRPTDGAINAPGGAPGNRLQASVCAGTSASVALGVSANSAPSVTVFVVIGAMTGGVLPARVTVVCASAEACA